jgi:hypothetical protein
MWKTDSFLQKFCGEVLWLGHIQQSPKIGENIWDRQALQKERGQGACIVWGNSKDVFVCLKLAKFL